MKKVMMMAVAAATFACNAALMPVACAECGASGSSECDTIVFKVTGSGKAVATDKGYKTVKQLKVKKGALALFGAYCSLTDTCCYETGMFYATIKVGKKSVHVAQEVELGVWSLFGKNLESTRAVNLKRCKTYKLESALYVEGVDGTYITDDSEIEDLTFAASAFGKIEVGVPKLKKQKGCSTCTEVCTDCTPVYTPKKYSGWFVGKYACVGPEDCFMCDCSNTDVFGGTWKAAYTSKVITDAGARQLAGVDISDDL